MTRARDASEAARRAEPRGIGSAGARDPLAREVKLLGALLGQVIVEQEGPALFELVEQLRRAAIRGRRGGPEETIQRALHALDGRSATELLAVDRAFTAYFLLINLAEEKHRLRTLRKRERSGSRAPLADGIGAAVLRLRRDGISRDDVRAFAGRMSKVLRLTGSARLLDRSPRLQRSIELRTPYVDVLSELQVRGLARLRGGSLGADERAATERLLQLTVSGLAAGLQHTG